MQKRASKRTRFPFPCRPGLTLLFGHFWWFLMVFENLVFAYLTVLFAYACLKLMHFECEIWIQYSSFCLCRSKSVVRYSFLYSNLNTVRDFLHTDHQKYRKVFKIEVQFEYSTSFFAYGSAKVLYSIHFFLNFTLFAVKFEYSTTLFWIHTQNVT